MDMLDSIYTEASALIKDQYSVSVVRTRRGSLGEREAYCLRIRDTRLTSRIRNFVYFDPVEVEALPPSALRGHILLVLKNEKLDTYLK